jgi:hypothetical protein
MHHLWQHLLQCQSKAAWRPAIDFRSKLHITAHGLVTSAAKARTKNASWIDIKYFRHEIFECQASEPGR